MAASESTWVDGVEPDCFARDLNGFKNENNVLIASTDIPLDVNDNSQTARAVSTYASSGSYYMDSGVANSYVLTPIGSRFAPSVYSEGMEIDFKPLNTNTGDSVVNVDGLGNITILTATGLPLPAASLIQNIYATLFFDGVDFRVARAPLGILSNVKDNIVIGGYISRNLFQKFILEDPAVGLNFDSSGDSIIADNFRLSGATAALGVSVTSVGQQTDAPFELFNAHMENEVQITNDAAVVLPSSEIAFIQTGVTYRTFLSAYRKPLVLQLGVFSSLAGVYNVALSSAQDQENYGQSFTIDAPNTWQSVTLLYTPTPENVDFLLTGGLLYSLRVKIVLASGSDFHGGSGSWSPTPNVINPSQVNWLANIGEIFKFCVLKLEVGIFATPMQVELDSTEAQETLYSKSYNSNESVGDFPANLSQWTSYAPATGVSVSLPTIPISPRITDDIGSVEVYDPATGVSGSIWNATTASLVAATADVTSKGLRIIVIDAITLGDVLNFHWSINSQPT